MRCLNCSATPTSVLLYRHVNNVQNGEYRTLPSQFQVETTIEDGRSSSCLQRADYCSHHSDVAKHCLHVSFLGGEQHLAPDLTMTMSANIKPENVLFLTEN